MIATSKPVEGRADISCAEETVAGMELRGRAAVAGGRAIAPVLAIKMRSIMDGWILGAALDTATFPRSTREVL